MSSDSLCLGERRKIGLFCPSAQVLRYSTITGALREIFGEDVYGVGGKLKGEAQVLTYGPRERVVKTSKLPLQIEFLTNASGEVYIDEMTAEKIEQQLKDNGEFLLWMGALKSKGFGRCKLKGGESLTSEELTCSLISLETRLPLFTKKYPLTEEELNKVREGEGTTHFLKEVFGIQRVVRPYFGYLFEPDKNRHSGNYVLSLFEGSLIEGPKFLGKDEKK